MAKIKDVYDWRNGHGSRSDSYRFTVETLNDPLYKSLVELTKNQNKIWRSNCIKLRRVSKYCQPRKVAAMPRGPRVDAVIREHGKEFVESNVYRRRMFDQNLPKKYATSFDVYVQTDNEQWRKMNDWVNSKIKDRKTWLKIQRLKREITDLEYYDHILPRKM